MRHYAKYLAVLAVIASSFFTQHVQAKNEIAPQMYMFGFAASFNDTIVHFTEIQQVDSTWINQKKFLLGRDNYSYQLRDYLANKLRMPNRTCIVVFNQNKKKLEKKYLKMKRKYTDLKANGFDVRNISTQDFHFRPINMSVEVEEPAIQKPEKKKDKKKEKEKKQK